MKILTNKQYNTLLIKADKNSKYKESEEVEDLKKRIKMLELRLKIAKNKNIAEYNEKLGGRKKNK